MMVMVVMFLLKFGEGSLDTLHPRGAGGHFLEIEEVGVEKIFERHVTPVAFYDSGRRLDGTHHFADMVGFLS